MSVVAISVSSFATAQDERGKAYTVFIINIRLGAYYWTIYRRYSQFKSLSDQLERKVAGVPLCPPRKLLGNKSPSFLDQRREELQMWLRQLATNESVCKCPEFHEFLRDQANVVPPGLVEARPPPVSVSPAPISAPQAPATPERPKTGGVRTPSSPPAAVATPAAEDSANRVDLKDFTLLKVLGKGSFGKVMQVRKKDTARVYAMKVLQKANIIRRKQVAHTITERNVLGQIDHPFIVGLNFAFQSSDKLYFVLDYCAGGELFFHLGKEGRFVEDRAKYYAAQITLALEHLHQHDIIYRDLKPENVLLDRYGNVRLTDFGLSKENVSALDSGAFTFCGTPEYLAPEILNRAGHGRAVDWWSLGALLYEMLTGLPPFYCRDHKALFDKIRRGRLEFPPYVSAEAQSLLNGLLTKDPVKRLGCGPGDASEIKAHPFFRAIDFDALLQRKLPPPWAPAVASSIDTSQFDQEFTNMPLHSPPQRDRTDSTAGQAVAPVNFDGFTYVAPSTVRRPEQATISDDSDGALDDPADSEWCEVVAPDVDVDVDGDVDTSMDVAPSDGGGHGMPTGYGFAVGAMAYPVAAK